ncbi:predicted protein [Arabidopsis lyrata subsp. lyrata]|uniref:Predicted protein n=1 Tax=Arabidopsis lyrata subsp. lyrata TaxID=81972 RepID=D7LAE4_ARALL|nr:predicted protein [Arabidopsis lyrata subsp. lyrata]
MELTNVNVNNLQVKGNDKANGLHCKLRTYRKTSYQKANEEEIIHYQRLISEKLVEYSGVHLSHVDLRKLISSKWVQARVLHSIFYQAENVMIDGQFTDLNAEVDVTHQRVYILPQEVIDLKEKKKTCTISLQELLDGFDECIKQYRCSHFFTKIALRS